MPLTREDIQADLSGLFLTDDLIAEDAYYCRKRQADQAIRVIPVRNGGTKNMSLAGAQAVSNRQPIAAIVSRADVPVVVVNSDRIKMKRNIGDTSNTDFVVAEIIEQDQAKFKLSLR